MKKSLLAIALVVLIISIGSFFIFTNNSIFNLNNQKTDTEKDNTIDNSIEKELSKEEFVEEDILEDNILDILKDLGEESAPIFEQQKLVNGKTLEERLDEAYSKLHAEGSEKQIRDDFPDIELVFSDDGKDDGFSSDIIPFDYYYS